MKPEFSQVFWVPDIQVSFVVLAQADVVKD